MKVIEGGATRDVRAVWMDEAGAVWMIDQRLLPRKVEFLKFNAPLQVAQAIRNMTIRGAPSIGAAAAYGMALAAENGLPLDASAKLIKESRPTANDLFFAVDHMVRELKAGTNPVVAANHYADSIVDRCKSIGRHGAPLIQDHAKLLTHCNAGALATVDYGTALAPMRVAKAEGRDFFVWVDETRPRLQGAKLTAWELLNEGIPHAVITDSAAGHYFQRGEVSLVITGADRIVANGDFANKIGTYTKALLAHEHKVPFYVAAPLSTFDFSLQTGKEIPIEERSAEEVTKIGGEQLAPQGSPACNPAFDVTPARFVKGFITEFGIVEPAAVAQLKGKSKFEGAPP